MSMREIYLLATMFTRETFLPEKHASQKNISLAYIPPERPYVYLTGCASQMRTSHRRASRRAPKSAKARLEVDFQR